MKREYISEGKGRKRSENDVEETSFQVPIADSKKKNLKKPFSSTDSLK